MKTTTPAAYLVLTEFRSRRSDTQGFRKQLLEAGLCKGTVSRMCSILRALKTRTITPSDVTSLHHAYRLIQENKKRISSKEMIASMELDLTHAPENFTEMASFLVGQGWYKTH